MKSSYMIHDIIHFIDVIYVPILHVCKQVRSYIIVENFVSARARALHYTNYKFIIIIISAIIVYDVHIIIKHDGYNNYGVLYSSRLFIMTTHATRHRLLTIQSNKYKYSRAYYIHSVEVWGSIEKSIRTSIYFNRFNLNRN